MKLWFRKGRWSLRCDCGFTCEAITMEWLGRQYDVHMAEKYPNGSERRPCQFPVTSMHSIPFEYDPTPLQPGEHHVVERTGGTGPPVRLFIAKEYPFHCVRCGRETIQISNGLCKDCDNEELEAYRNA